MQQLSRVPAQLGKLPIPPATLIIDTRGVSDDLLETLEIELENFAGDTHLDAIKHWRYFTNFVGHKAIDPLSLKEVEGLLRLDSTAPRSANASVTPPRPPKTFTGRADPNPVNTYTSPPYYQEEIQNPPLGQIPHDAFRHNIDSCIGEIDDLRNRRLNATADLGKTGDFGRHIKDSMVRAIFLTDAKRPDSLSTAAVYAEYLKRYYNKLEHDNHPLAFNTTIICLNHTNWGNSPENLMNRLSRKQEEDEWSHINSLILSEEYRQDAGRLKEDMQKYIAELLLYIILLIPPSAIRTDTPDIEEYYPNPDPQKFRRRDLPPASYIVGVSAIEHSVRWGRRYLNFGLAEQTLDLLRSRPSIDEQGRNENAARSWLSEWRNDILDEVPDNIPGDVPALAAFPHARSVASKPVEELFHSRGLRLLRHDTTIEDIEQHTNDLACTLVMTPQEYTERRSSGASGEVFTFQDSVDNLPQIQQNVLATRAKQRGPVSPFVDLLVKAQRVLSDRRFFLSANGAIERGKRQLTELNKQINQLQDEHNDELDLARRRSDFEASSRSKIADLSEHIQSFPWLASVSNVLKVIMAILALVFAIFLTIAAELGLFAWIYSLVSALFPGVISALAFQIVAVPLFTVLVIAVVILTAFIVGLNFGRYILAHERTTRRVEMTFWILLLIFGLVGVFISLSPRWIVDPFLLLTNGVVVGSVPFLSGLALVLALLMLIIEVAYFFSWSSTLERKRRTIIEQLRVEHAAIQRDVRRYITDAIALDLLKEVGLTDGSGGEGPYQAHMTALSSFVDGVQAETAQQFHRAENSLIVRQNATANPTTSALLVRSEQLDVEGLMGNYKLLSESMARNRPETDELAEALLRAMGTESAATIERDLRERATSQPTTKKVVLADWREKHNAEVLASTSVSVLTRFATVSPQSYDDAVTLQERYKALDHRIQPLFSTLKALVDQVERKATASRQNSTITQKEIAEAFAWWAQILWEHKVADLVELLNSEGVMAKLQQERYNPQTVRDTLEILANLVGRPVMANQVSERYLLMFPSAEGRQFFLNQKMESHFIDFPDAERLVLLYIQHYIAKPAYIERLQISAPVAATVNSTVVDSSLANGQQGQATGSDTSNGSTNGGTIV